MRQPQFTNRFKKDLKCQKKSGNWTGYRECHIESDWLLIYTVQDETATFYRTGSHADLFN